MSASSPSAATTSQPSPDIQQLVGLLAVDAASVRFQSQAFQPQTLEQPFQTCKQFPSTCKATARQPASNFAAPNPALDRRRRKT